MIEAINIKTKRAFKKDYGITPFNYKSERSKTTIVGEIGETEISLTAQPESYNQNDIETGDGLMTLDATSLIMEKVIGLNHRAANAVKIAQDLYDIGTLYYLQKESIDVDFINAEILNRGEDASELANQIDTIGRFDDPREQVKEILT